LVNSASVFRDDRLATLSPESLDTHMRTNLYAPLFLTRAFAAALGEDGGSVVMLLDQRVRNPVPDQLAYSLSKQALHASLRNLARELAPRIRVNGVAPGLVLPTDDYDPAQWERLRALMPLQRLPMPEDIARAVVYLARAPAVTGETLFVDAGANLESYARDFVYLGKQ
jgi:NAD(P)-dependent dehydrogenase (short-subunit alcohol dehydrogenase family)